MQVDAIFARAEMIIKWEKNHVQIISYAVWTPGVG